LFIEKSKVESLQQIGERTFLLKVFSQKIARIVKPGQFCNIKVSENDFPLLRRPFSVCDVEDDSIFFLFDIHGEGTKILTRKKHGEDLDILGPLGNGFVIDGDYEIAVIVAGGLGAAPFPLLTKRLNGKNVASLVGAKNSDLIVTERLQNTFISTDDGSLGYKGNVIELLKKYLDEENLKSFRIFSCGPNAMLKALQKYSIANNFDCQLSIECAMACGFGICQGCPIETNDGEGYKLVCKDGPVFNAAEIKL
jgi:dihydroorotate dehydrogenase electron transfer subunit